MTTIKTPKLLKIINTGVTNLLEPKLKITKNNSIKTCNKNAKNIHVSLRLEFFDLIGEIVKSRFPCVNTKIIHLKSAEAF